MVRKPSLLEQCGEKIGALTAGLSQINMISTRQRKFQKHRNIALTQKL